MDLVNKFADWPFLNEPLYRWAMFGVATIGFLYAFNGVHRYMKE